MTNKPYFRSAAQLIASDDECVYDVASNCGQMVANVKHMSWFRKAVADDCEGWYLRTNKGASQGPFSSRAEAEAFATKLASE